MSGGSYDYLSFKIDDMADCIPLHSSCDNHVRASLRAAFKKHLHLVAEACHAIEWNDSGDGDDDEIAKIEACLPRDAELRAAIEEAETTLASLTAAIERARAAK